MKLVGPRKKRPESGSQQPQVQRQRSPKDLKGVERGRALLFGLDMF